MAERYWKATRPNGRDFYSDTIDYAAALEGGEPIKLRNRLQVPDEYYCCSPDVLHASDVPTETLIGGSWPCRLFVVTGKSVAQEDHKHGFRTLRVIEEVDATLALGPQGKELAALIEAAAGITHDQARELSAAWSAVGSAAWAAAWSAVGSAARSAAESAARSAAESAAESAAWAAAWSAVDGLLVRDLICTADYDTLTGPWRRIVGRIHPDDPDMV